MELSLEEIEIVYERIKPHIHETPLLTSSTLDSIVNSLRQELHLPPISVYLKCENFQKIGAFKIRGATNAVLQYIQQQQQQGQPLDGLSVVTHSSGNHAQALALAAKTNHITAHIIMPNTSPSVKKDAVEHTYHGKVYLSEPTQQARETLCQQVQQQHNAFFIHPYDNEWVIQGQSTVVYEILTKQLPEVDAVLCCVGGGGLLSGTSLCCNAWNQKQKEKKIKVYGCEPVGANDTYRGFKLKQRQAKHEEGKPNTICDGLLTCLSERTFSIISNHVKDVFQVTEEQIIKAMKFVYERMKIIIEPSSAVTVAALLFDEECRRIVLSDASVKHVVCIISGGNVDLTNLSKWFSSV